MVFLGHLVRLQLLLAGLTFLAACAAGPERGFGPRQAGAQDVAMLAEAILALDPEVSDEDAYRAARVSFAESYRLAQVYEIEDHPLTHNTKVNLGKKPRGLCYHWADDLEKRLKREGFQTLSLHRGVANFDSIRLEHSTVIVSARGQGMFDGIVLDPWRKGGRLTWVHTEKDPRYRWRPREEVFRIRRERRAREAAQL